MNITFLVGNGFDINLGLDTKYSDFLKTYTGNFRSEVPKDIDQLEKKEDFQEFNAIELFKKDILSDFEMWSSAEEAFGKYTTSFFERKGNAQYFCHCHEDFCEKLASYLRDEEKYFDFEKQKSFIIENFAKAISFSSIIKGFREKQKQQLRNAEKTFSGSYNYSFINFNYTTTLDKCVLGLKNEPKLLGTRTTSVAIQNTIKNLIHVHGTTDRDMVLGLNDESQIDCLALFEGYGSEYKNELIKPETNEMNEENMDSKTLNILEQSDLIYIYGMSLGNTDRLWWQRILKLMLRKINLHIIIYCYDRPQKTLIRREIKTYDDKIKKHFLSFYDIDDNNEEENLRERIHITDDNIFSCLTDLAKKSLNIPNLEQLEQLELVRV